ncbi:MAG: polysaccharide biosynthesis/export family protein [Bacteroidota bacterium]
MKHKLNIYNILPILFLSSLFWSGCSPSTETVQSSSSRSTTGSIKADTIRTNYIIKVGDQIELSVWGYPEFQTSTTVKESGIITLPLAGDIRVAGLSKQSLIDVVRKKLADFIQGEPEITANITSPSSVRKISVLGAVNRQDNYPVSGDVTLLEILSTAGGSTAESDFSHIKIIHKGISKSSSEVDLSETMENGNFDDLPKVHPGDVVFVPKKENVIRSFSDFIRDAVLLFGMFRIFY